MKISMIIPALLLTVSITDCGDSNNTQSTNTTPTNPVEELQAGGFLATRFKNFTSNSAQGNKLAGTSKALDRTQKKPPQIQHANSKLNGSIWSGAGVGLDSIFGSAMFPGEKRSPNIYALSIGFEKNVMRVALGCRFSDDSLLTPSNSVDIPVTIDGTKVYLHEELTIETTSSNGKNACAVQLMGDYLDFKFVTFSDGQGSADIGGVKFNRGN